MRNINICYYNINMIYSYFHGKILELYDFKKLYNKTSNTTICFLFKHTQH